MTGIEKSADFGRRLTPPRLLTKPEATVFRSIVSAVASDHFVLADVPLLVEFARATCLANLAAEKIEQFGAVNDARPSPWITVQEKAQRALVALSARLRLCPQSRFDRTRAGTGSRTGLPNAEYPDGYDPDDPDGLLAGNRPHAEFPKRKLTGLAAFRR